MSLESERPAPHLSTEEFRRLAHRTVDWIADYLETVESRPVLSRVRPGQVAAEIPEHAPEQGMEGWDAVFADLERIIVPGLTHWQSPNFFAFFPSNTSGPGIIGEMLSAGLGVNGMLWATSPAATELETRVLDWLGEMMGLPDDFLSRGGTGGGVIQGTASESTLVAMLAARERARRSGAPDDGLVAYASTQAHSSVVKAAMVSGVARGPDDRGRMRLIDTDENHAMRPDLLSAAMSQDLAAGRRPFYVCATVGTTSSTAVDPVGEIAGVIAGRAGGSAPAWLHVDAAHSGAAFICPEFRGMAGGVDRADSLCFNPHKWLLTNFDCDCFWTRDKGALTGALSIAPEYLRNAASEAGAVVDYRDWQIPLGRRFRALKLWLVIRHYGVEGLRAHVRGHVRLAARFEAWVRQDPRFEVAAPRTVNLVCFRLRGDGAAADAQNRRLLESINSTGHAYLTHTVLRDGKGNDRVVLRMCIGATMTQERHVAAAWDLIKSLAGTVG